VSVKEIASARLYTVGKKEGGGVPTWTINPLFRRKFWKANEESERKVGLSLEWSRRKRGKGICTLR